MSSGPEVVAEDRPGSYALWADGRLQSHVDLVEPTRIALDYVRRLADAVDAVADPGLPIRAVHLGGGGLTLPRYVVATRPRSSQIVLEPDAELTELVRREVPLPARSGIRIRPVAGRAGLGALRDGSARLIVLDAFAAGRMPADLASGECFAELARVLEPGGLLAANLVDRAPFPHARRVIAGIRSVFADVALTAEPATLRGRRPGNLVVLAGDRVPLAALRAGLARDIAPHRLLDAAAVSDGFGGGRPFTDAETHPGPAFAD